LEAYFSVDSNATLHLSKTDQDMSHFMWLPTAFQVYSSLDIKLWNPKFNAQKGINHFQTLLHSQPWEGELLMNFKPRDG